VASHNEGCIIMKCPLCGGKMKKENIEYEKHWGKKIYSFKKVPAFVCVSCADVLLTGEAARAMEDIIAGKEKPEEYIEVPVYSLDKHLVKAS